MKWIEFREPRPSATGKTFIWPVVTRADNVTLGRVAWMSGWRRYAFFPDPATIFEESCLRDIAEFCRARTAERKVRT